MQYAKAKSVSKKVLGRGTPLQTLILKTMKTISEVVGSTLGPGGMSVVIERQEENLPPMITKDGVTVFRNLGFDDSAAHVLMEAARDASVRTAAEAGDGPQPLWSKVLTPNGYVAMKDVAAGMVVCGTNGTTQKVLGVYPKGRKNLVRVTFEGGRQVECCEDHLWSVMTSYGAGKILTTREMLKDFVSIGNDGQRMFRYYVPKPGAVMFRDAKTPLDPYLVGVLLGDGSLADSGSVELSLGKAKEHIISKLKLPEGIVLKTDWIPNKNAYRVKIQGKGSDGRTIRDFLDEVGLRNQDSFSKFIPSEYLLGTQQSREALLQGLIDTDGHINTRGRFEFSTVSEQLARDFRALCEGLGISLWHGLHLRDEDEGSYSDNPIHRFAQLKGARYGDKIVDIQVTECVTEMQCIKVSNEDHLYITDGCIATHNTTTASILSEALVRKTLEFTEANPKVSPQRVVRTLEKGYQLVIEPWIKAHVLKASLGTPEGRERLHAVAKVSANGDVPLADAVLQCFDLTGDEGNVTIVEASGPSGYEVERIEGYPVFRGYEDCCGKFYQQFINDPGRQMVTLDRPTYILYHGRLNDIYSALPIFDKINDAAQAGQLTPNVVLATTGFSEVVLAHLATNFRHSGTINVYPLTAPLSAMSTGQYDFLADLAALSGGRIFDPLNAPLDNAELDQLGQTSGFEAGRFRSTVLGYKEELLVLERVDELKKQLNGDISELDRSLLQERIGKISGGIAKLKVIGSSNGEVREKRDRAEDAICAVRGALKHGCLPAGGWSLLKLWDFIKSLTADDGQFNVVEISIFEKVLAEALLEPVDRLFFNAGYTKEDQMGIVPQILNGSLEIFDVLDGRLVDALEGGLLDSAPAVSESIRNSISIASLLGTCGGLVVYPRDREVELQEARDTADFLRNANVNPADERG